MSPVEGQTFGRYKVIKLLGEGAMGRVFLSEDPILKRQVAVKVIAMDKHLDQVTLKEYLERFSLEAQACAKLNHPSIVSIFDAGEQDGIPWIAFEYVEGERLDEFIKKSGKLPHDQISRILRDISSAVAHAHSMNIVHRDIKPANILIDSRTGIAKLADFGVVKSPCTALTQSGTSVGSPGYMSPEQIEGGEVDARSDLFSLGIVLYEMITGVHPFLRDTIPTTFYATLNCTFKPIRELRGDIPLIFEQILSKSLVANKNDRLQNAEQLCKMLCGESTPSLHQNQNAFSSFKIVVRHITKTLKYLYRILHPIVVKTISLLVQFTKDQIFPLIKLLCKKGYSILLKKFSRDQIKTTLIIAPSAAAVLVLALLIFTLQTRSKDLENLRTDAITKGFLITQARYIPDSCRVLIRDRELERAGILADILQSHKVSHLQGIMFKGLIALSQENYKDATSAFSILAKSKEGKREIKSEIPFLMSFYRSRLERELPPPLVDLAAHQLGMAENRQLKVWTEHKHYWIRWNAVRILKNAGKVVDLVPVYTLDLTYSASTKTKVRAAEMLGELGDDRAIPALVKASKRGPASWTASRVLKEKFNYEEPD